VDQINGDDPINVISRAMKASDIPPGMHDFYRNPTPVDAGQRPLPKGYVPPKFHFGVFHLDGAGYDAEEIIEYGIVMNKVTAGKVVKLREEIYHSKEGDIKVFLQWVEFVEPAPAKKKPGEVTMDAQGLMAEPAMKEDKPSRRQRKKGKKASKTEITKDPDTPM